MSPSIRTLAIAAAAALALSAATARAQSLTTPTLLRPVLNGSSNGFTLQYPNTPAISSTHKRLLVDDYPDVGIDGLQPFTYIANPGTTDQSQLFYMDGLIERTLYSSCTLHAHLLAQSSNSSTAAFLIKIGGTTSEGSQFTVTGSNDLLADYTRVMFVNPVSNAAWTDTDLTAANVQAGVKNYTGGAVPISMADLLLVCQ